MALAPGDIARAVEMTTQTMGRAASVMPPATGAALVRMVALIDAHMQAIHGLAPQMNSAHLWTPADQAALDALESNVAHLDTITGSIADDATPSVHDAADAAAALASASAFHNALTARLSAARQCHDSGGHPISCASSALTLHTTPHVPVIASSGAAATASASARRPVYIALGVLGVALAVGGIALYAGKRKHFLSGFHDPRPARIRARARAGAPRGRSYDLEVED